MLFWHYWIIFGLILFIVEMFTPAMFFLNLAVAAIVAALAAFLGFNLTVQVFVFAAVSLVLLMFLRPYFLKNMPKTLPAIEDTYIGKVATTISPTSEFDGRIRIYDEEWQARSLDKTAIEAGKKVKIIKNKSLIMYVEEIKE